MSDKSEKESPLKLFKLINPRSEEIPTLVYIRKPWQAEEEEIWSKELRLLDLKYKAMKIKISERVPINSKRENFQWYLTKDKYGLIYFFLAQDNFEEKYIFKMHKKISNFLETNIEKIEDFEQKEFFYQRILEIVDEFNVAIERNLQISSDNSDVQILEKEAEEFIIDGETPVNEVSSNEEQNVFVLLEKRNKRVYNIQLVFIIACMVSILLAIIHFFMYVKNKK